MRACRCHGNVCMQVTRYTKAGKGGKLSTAPLAETMGKVQQLYPYPYHQPQPQAQAQAQA